MKRVISFVLAALLLALPCLAWAEEAEEIETIVTIVAAPEQTKAERPPCFPDPADKFIPLPETENFALNKTVISGKHADVYVDKNVNDGSTNTNWESLGLPAEITIVLGESYTISTVAVCLNTSSIWEPRVQEIAVQISQDGELFTEAVPAAQYQFDAEFGNRIRIDFDPVQATYVKLVFTMNSAARTEGAQAAEICVY